MRAGDAGDRADLIPGDDRGRCGLAGIRQELVDEVQRAVGRTLIGARLVGLIYGLINELVDGLIARLRRVRLARDSLR